MRFKPWRRRVPRATLLAGAMLILTGCATTTDTAAPTEPLHAATLTATCNSFAPISWSKADTDTTIRDVHQHNAIYHAICEGRP